MFSFRCYLADRESATKWRIVLVPDVEPGDMAPAYDHEIPRLDVNNDAALAVALETPLNQWFPNDVSVFVTVTNEDHYRFYRNHPRKERPQP